MINGINNNLQVYGYSVVRNAIFCRREKTDNMGPLRTSKVSTVAREAPTDDPLDYYYEFVKQYPDVSFRLVDKEDSEKHPDGPYYGYKGHMNQVGDNFSYPSQVSVEIDVAVIRRMMEDENYAKRVHSEMHNSIDNYSSCRQSSLTDGCTNFCVTLEVGDDGLLVGTKAAPYPFFTEEQRRALWAMYDTSDNKYLKMLAQRRDELEEDFMKMVAERQEDRLTYEQIREKWDREYQKTYSE